MRLRTPLSAAAFAVVALALSCDHKQPLSPVERVNVPRAADNVGPVVVISQVYGGGGNSGATYKNDFVELFNRGDAAASLSGWSIQYASATGTGNFGSNSPVALSGSIPAGGYLLVQLAGGTNGIPLPTPDVVATGPNLAAGSGKVIVANTASGLACNGGSTPCSAAQLAQIVDLVGYGTANFYEGASAAPAISGNVTAEFRKDDGCRDTNNNGADFVTGTPPTPRNSASAQRSCSGGPPASVTLTPDTASVSVGATQALTAEVRNADGYLIGDQLTWSTGDAAIATVSASGVLTGVALDTTFVTVTTSNGLADTSVVVVTPPVIRWLDVSSSGTSFPPGFQTQLFATARTASGGLVVPANFTYEALNPSVATVTPVLNTAIVTGVSPGVAQIRITATPVDGATPPYAFTTKSITIETPAAVDPSIYATNDEFGDPAAASPSDPDALLVVRPQYTISYNESRGTPNWVSYELDSRQMGGQDRCNCFSADPLLPASKQILTSDYTNGGYDRGHMTRSFDRTATNSDNAVTFYLTNIVPQLADLNQGPWANFENALGDSAEAGRAVYIITGPLYSRSHGLTFLKNEGKVAVPDSTWKVALIGPRNAGIPFGLASLQGWSDLPGHTVLAVNMPNVAGVKNVPWTSYLTSVASIEAATGYDFLSLIPVAFQHALEVNDRAPAPAFASSGTLLPAATIAFDGAASSDPDLGRTDMGQAEALSYAWDFGDGSVATGVTSSHVFGRSGSFVVTLTATDAWGWPSAVSHTVTIVTPLDGVAALADQVGGLGTLDKGALNSLGAKLNAATASCRRDGTPACANQVGAFVNEVEALVNSGRLGSDAAAPILAYAELLIDSLRL